MASETSFYSVLALLAVSRDTREHIQIKKHERNMKNQLISQYLEYISRVQKILVTSWGVHINLLHGKSGFWGIGN
jgi:protein-S-isoprenylcysteine O-methyltransferase Ste14